MDYSFCYRLNCVPFTQLRHVEVLTLVLVNETLSATGNTYRFFHTAIIEYLYYVGIQ